MSRFNPFDSVAALEKYAERLRPDQRTFVLEQLAQPAKPNPPAKALQKVGSSLEEEFLRQIRALRTLEPEREYAFALEQGRKFRFDFAWVLPQIAAEIDGGTRNQGRHTRHEGFHRDCDKFNLALELGWAAFRFTSEHVTNGQAAQTMARVLEQGRRIL